MSVAFGPNKKKSKLIELIEDPDTDLQDLLDTIIHSTSQEKSDALVVAARLADHTGVDYLLRYRAKVTDEALQAARGRDEGIYEQLRAAY